jgi:hypothetical protein
LRDADPSVRATVISALRYTFIDSARSYDELLGPVIVDFLSLIKDQDLVSTAIPFYLFRLKLPLGRSTTRIIGSQFSSQE